MEVSKCCTMFEFQTVLIKMKNCKTFYEPQILSCLGEIIEPPPNPHPNPHHINSYSVIGTKLSYEDIQK